MNRSKEAMKNVNTNHSLLGKSVYCISYCAFNPINNANKGFLIAFTFIGMEMDAQKEFYSFL